MSRFFLVTCLLLSLAVCAQAQEPGDTVITKGETVLRVGEKIVETVPKNTALIVKKKNDKWLWVQSPANNGGWLLKSEVVLAAPDAPNTPHPTQNESSLPVVGGTGTAFVVHPEGYLVTNRHVVKPEKERLLTAKTKITVTVGKLNYLAKVKRIDHEHDLAILKVDGKDLPVILLADSDKAKLGQDVRAFGYPLSSSSLLGRSLKVTKGTISGIEKTANGRVFQTDTTINPGNSGGPLVNQDGEVIAVVTAILNEHELRKRGLNFGNNLGFCIPANVVRRLFGHEQISLPDSKANPNRKLELVEAVAPAVGYVQLRHQLWGIPQQDYKVKQIAISRHGVIAATADQGEVRLWSLTSGALLRTIKVEPGQFGQKELPKIAIAEDGRELAVSTFTHGLNVTSSSPITLKKLDPAKNPAVEYSADGQILAAFELSGKRYDEATIKVFRNGRLEKTIPTGLKAGMSSNDYLAFSPDARYLAIFLSLGSKDQLAVFELATGRKRLVVEGGKHLSSLAFSKDGKLLTAGGTVWDIESGTQVWSTGKFDRSGFLPYGQLLFAHDAIGFHVWDLRFKNEGVGSAKICEIRFSKELAELFEKTPTAHHRVVSRDGSCLVIAGAWGGIAAWNLKDRLRDEFMRLRIDPPPGFGD